MDITPSTVSTGDTITLLVTRSGGDVTPVEHECSLFLNGDVAELESCLDTHEVVEIEATVTKCMWAQSKGSDMLSVTVESCRGKATTEPVAEPAPVSAGESPPDSVPADERGATEAPEADTSTDGVAEETADHGSTSDSTGPEEARRLEQEAGAVVEWDPNESLDRETLQRVLNRGRRVPPTTEEHDLDYSDRNAVEIADILIDIAVELEVTSPVCYRAAELYAGAMEHDLVQGQAKEVTAAAALRVASLEADEHRPIVAIEEALENSCEKDIHSGSIAGKERQLISGLDVDPKIMLIQPQKYLPYLARQLGIDEDAPIVQKAATLASEAATQGSGSSRWSIAAAAMYCAGLQDGTQKYTQRQIAQAASLTEVTIRNNYKSMDGD